MPNQDRRGIPQTINFHPLYIEHLQLNNFAAWTQTDIDLVTHPDARLHFRDKGKKYNTILSPVDGLLGKTFIRTVIHEVSFLIAHALCALYND